MSPAETWLLLPVLLVGGVVIWAGAACAVNAILDVMLGVEREDKRARHDEEKGGQL